MAQRADGRSTHNLFGIKADRGWNGDTSLNGTREYSGGEWRSEKASFRAYDSEQRSIKDFANFISRNPRYRNALVNSADPERFLREMHAAGYATDPEYADKAIAIMNKIIASGQVAQ